jgi:hypothetical protein
MMNSNPSSISSMPAGQGHKCEHFLGDGQRDTFNLHEVPSSVHAITARVSGPLHATSIPLVIGNFRLDTFIAGYDALVDRVGKRIYLEHALPKGELLLVEYPFDDPNQSAAVPAAPHSQAEPCNIPGWESWDYQNWRDFAAAMGEDKPIEYAMCVWLMQQESTDLAFQEGEWSAWYHYARKHCLRFDREQPRWKRIDE